MPRQANNEGAISKGSNQASPEQVRRALMAVTTATCRWNRPSRMSCLVEMEPRPARAERTRRGQRCCRDWRARRSNHLASSRCR
jgi:hypothetical protein